MKRAHILIIDDEESIRITFSSFLSKEGYAVVTADSYESAIERLQESRFDLVFADIILGDHSGVKILGEVKARGMHCPVIMITGNPNIESAAESLRMDAFDYLSKPIKKDTLIRVTKHALQHKTLLDEKAFLEAENERYRLNLEAIFRSVEDAIITVDNDMRVIEANHASEAVFGLNPKGLDLSVCENDDNQCLKICFTLLQQTLATRKYVQEYRIECDREQHPHQVLVLNTSLLKDHHDNAIGAVLIIRDITRLSHLEKELKDRHQFHNIIGKNNRIQEIFNLLEDLKDTATTVLITGESGTGKELVAKALHYSGIRAHRTFVAVNCSALAENLLESELFGHVKGAFTGAIKDKEGRFQLANHGTIFLDEIGDISPRIQLKLLRVLEEKAFERVGDNRQIKVDVRVIAATNRDLKELVRRGEFREDLYYRLKVVEIRIPPLRERRDDLLLLINHFIAFFNRRFGKAIEGVALEAEKALFEYPWPGNIRELQHAIEHAFVICRDKVIRLGDLPPEIKEQGPVSVADTRGGTQDLLGALEQAGWNKAKAARILGISRQTIYRKIREHQLEEPGGQTV